MATKYWDNRAALRQLAYDRANNQVVSDISRAYNRASAQLGQDIDTIIGVYTRKTGLTPQDAMAYLKEGVPSDILNSLRLRASNITDIAQRKQLGVILRTDAYRARISRIDAINEAIRVGYTEAADVELQLLAPHLRNIGNMAYSRMMFDVQKVTAGFKMVGVPTRALDTILKSKWAGISYSESVWQNRDGMVDLLRKAMMEKVGIGKLSDASLQDLRGNVSLDKWRKQLKSKFKSEAEYAKYAANRLVRTESAYVANQTTAIAYDECGIAEYEYMATLDSRTSRKCGDLDGQRFKVADKEIGVNFPPAHPHCRSQTSPVLDTQDNSLRTRAAQGRDGKTVKIPRSMDYQSWKAWQDDGAPDIASWRKGETAPVGALAQKVTDALKK